LLQTNPAHNLRRTQEDSRGCYSFEETNQGLQAEKVYPSDDDSFKLYGIDDVAGVSKSEHWNPNKFYCGSVYRQGFVAAERFVP